MGYYSTFVVRLWVDKGKMVKGTIQRLGMSGDGSTFSTWDMMVDFMIHNMRPSILNSIDTQENSDSQKLEYHKENTISGEA